MTFARLVLAAASNDTLPDPQDWALPTRQTTFSIVNYYMMNIYSLYPAFSETDLFNTVNHMYAPHDKRIKDGDYWLAYMVLAVGSMAQSQAAQDEHYINGLHFAAKALAHADGALMPGCVTQIRSLILLTQYSMLDPAHFDSWHLIGFTCRSVIDLGYHQDPPPEQMPNKDMLDMRRKTFYCVYSLDRQVSFPAALTAAGSNQPCAGPSVWCTPVPFASPTTLRTLPGRGRIHSTVGPPSQAKCSQDQSPPSCFFSCVAPSPSGTRHCSSRTLRPCRMPHPSYGACARRCASGPTLCPRRCRLACASCSTSRCATASCIVLRRRLERLA